jgi:4-diphosphocytidyl-2-C-methyl-D-erythritol kinase
MRAWQPVSLGSDVPALLFGGPVVARGRGELVEPVGLPRTWWVLVTSEPGIASRDAYAWWDEDRPVSIGDLASVIDALRASPETARSGLVNDLQGPVVERRPDVRQVLDRAGAAGAFGALLSGSGPTVAALARDGTHAEKLAHDLGGIVAASVGSP